MPIAAVVDEKVSEENKCLIITNVNSDSTLTLSAAVTHFHNFSVWQ